MLRSRTASNSHWFARASSRLAWRTPTKRLHVIEGDPANIVATSAVCGFELRSWFEFTTCFSPWTKRGPKCKKCQKFVRSNLIRPC